MIKLLQQPGGIELVAQTCTAALSRLAQQSSWHTQQYSSKSEARKAEPGPPAGLSDAQLKSLTSAVASATEGSRKACALASAVVMAANYRDINVSLDALYAIKVQGKHPLQADPIPDSLPELKPPSANSTIFPLVDVTQFPDDEPNLPQGPQQYESQYMDRITCWAQTQPNHVETSTLLQTGISLFPPQEVTYPTYVDFQSAMSLLERHKSRKRLRILRTMKRTYLDKYQMKQWEYKPSFE